MPSTQSIKRRIKSVKNTRQITKAMELVAASKMRKSQEASLRSKAYSNTARELLAKLSLVTKLEDNQYFQALPVFTRLHIVITSDKGLAGAYNTNVLKSFYAALEQDREDQIGSVVIAVGSKGAKATAKLKDVDVLAAYEGLSDHLNESEIQPILSTIMNQFSTLKVQEVVIHYTEFKSTILQQTKAQTLLPISVDPELASKVRDDEVRFEPSEQEVLETITPRLVEVQFYQAYLESLASEHSMRMMAMKSASDNANDLIDDLTLEFNSARQAAITQELAEISGGVEAIS